MAAAVLHFGLALGLFWVARAQLVPSLIDSDGIIESFAFDSHGYQRSATRLVGVLRHEGVIVWVSEPEPMHVKLLSLEFALFAPVFGYSTLSAEPLNLCCYLVVVFLVLTLGREVGGPRIGLLAAAGVALLPTFLLHTMQFLKDPLFIAFALALILCVTTWLTRTYNRRWAIATSALMTLASVLLLFIRFEFVIVIFALALFGLALLVLRQWLERRLLWWNMVCASLILLALGVLLPFYLPSSHQRFKQYPSAEGGQLKSVQTAGLGPVPTMITYLPAKRYKQKAVLPYFARLYTYVDSVALRFGLIRSRFGAAYPESGSGLDPEVEFRDMGGLIHYLPRACEAGLWAPFPNTWAKAGRHVGANGRLLAGAETLIIYGCQLLALLALLRTRRNLSAWLLWALILFGVTGLGLVVPNVGALYRFRYTFWLLLIVLGMKGLAGIIALPEKGVRAPETIGAVG